MLLSIDQQLVMDERPLLAQSGRILHNHPIQCSHSFNERRYHEHMKTAVHDHFHVLNPPTTAYRGSSLETWGKDARSLKSAFRHGHQAIS